MGIGAQIAGGADTARAGAPSPLRLTVARTPAELLYISELEWVRRAATHITSTRGGSYPLEIRRDWQAEMVNHLWRNANRFDSSRAEGSARERASNDADAPTPWRKWANTVLHNRFFDLISRAAEEAKRLPPTTEQEQASLPDMLAGLALDTLAGEIRRVAQQEIEALYARDMRVAEYLSEAGGQRGAQADLIRELGITPPLLSQSMGRIRRAMLAVGLSPNPEVI